MLNRNNNQSGYDDSDRLQTVAPFSKKVKHFLSQEILIRNFTGDETSCTLYRINSNVLQLLICYKDHKI